MKFRTQLVRFGPGEKLSGFRSSGDIDPGQVAKEVFGKKLSGPMLLAYCIRRFGWPNIGSDDYRDLCGSIYLSAIVPGGSSRPRDPVVRPAPV